MWTFIHFPLEIFTTTKYCPEFHLEELIYSVSCSTFPKTMLYTEPELASKVLEKGFWTYTVNISIDN